MATNVALSGGRSGIFGAAPPDALRPKSPPFPDPDGWSKDFVMSSTIPPGRHVCEDVCIGDSQFTNVAMPRTRFDDVAMADCVFHNVNLSGAAFDDVNLSNVHITHANVEGMTLFGVKVTDLFAAYRSPR